MKLAQRIEIDLLDFLKNAKFDYIKLGQTKEWIINNFPDPDETYIDSYNSPIWFYGNIEFHFRDDDTLFLIYSDYIDTTLDGGDSLLLKKWIFDQPENLTIENVARHLAKERIGYKLEYGTFPGDYTSAVVKCLESGVALSFAFPERDEEEYEDYLKKLKTADSNLFQLVSFSLLAG
jgi:hypothetical protein